MKINGMCEQCKMARVLEAQREDWVHERNEVVRLTAQADLLTQRNDDMDYELATLRVKVETLIRENEMLRKSIVQLARAEPPAQRHSPTSVAAAESVHHAAIARQQVLNYIIRAANHGATDDEIQEGLGMNPSTERPRRIELWHAKLIEDSGRTRPTRSKRQAVVWTAAFGKAGAEGA